MTRSNCCRLRAIGNHSCQSCEEKLGPATTKSREPTDSSSGRSGSHPQLLLHADSRQRSGAALRDLLDADARTPWRLTEFIRHFLIRNGRDVEFRERFVSTKLYGGGDRIEKTKIILERLEESFEHKEPAPFSTLQIEASPVPHLQPSSRGYPLSAPSSSDPVFATDADGRLTRAYKVLARYEATAGQLPQYEKHPVVLPV
jgi:hypothetical protein